MPCYAFTKDCHSAIKLNIVFYIIAAFLFITAQPVYSSNNFSVENLLGEYQQKADLSTKTKKESAGQLIIFTREDLDRMKIKSLKELIDLVPLLIYGENAMGLSDLGYAPYQMNALNPVVVYINDREAIDPFGGNGLQLLGQLDMGYVDHVEIYAGLPSYEIGFDSAATVIKIYTKKGYRENAAVFGSSYATYGTTDNFIDMGSSLNNGWSYFVYLDNRRLHRKKSYHDHHMLSKDKTGTDFWGELENDNYRFEVQGVGGKIDNFIGDSWNMNVKKNRTDYQYIYGGLYYTSDDKDIKAHINYSYTLTNTTQISDGPLGVMMKKKEINPYLTILMPYLFDTEESKLEEHLANLAVRKKFKVTSSDKLMIGTRARYEKFIFKKIKLGNVEIPQNSFNREYVLTGYIENKYSINDKNLLTASLKAEKHFENGGVKNYMLYGYRLGYIFNNENLTSKTFLSYSDLAPSPYVLYNQKRMFPAHSISKRKGLMISSEVIYRHNRSVYEFEAGKLYYFHAIYFDENGYHNSDTRNVLSFVSSRYKYNFDPFNSIRLNVWLAHLKTASDLFKVYGGYIMLFNKIGKFDFYNSLSYRKNRYFSSTNTHARYNLDSTITYYASNNLSLHIKGTNLLNKATKTDYMRINPLNWQITRLNGVPDFDRQIWIGLEYKF